MTMSSGNDEIMTLREIAGYLKVSEKTIFRMIQAGDLPGAKVSNQWRFVRSVIDDWLDSRMYSAPRKELLHVIGTAPRIVPITRLVSKRRIVPNLKAGSRQEVLGQLVRALARTVPVPDAEALIDELIAREEVVSTALGRGIAFPHVRDPESMPVDVPCIVLGICRSGTDFGALDGGKTFIFALPCARSEVVHLRLMAELSLLFRKPGVVKRMRAADSKDVVMEILAAADKEILRGK